MRCRDAPVSRSRGPSEHGSGHASGRTWLRLAAMTAKGVNVPSSCLKDARFLRLVAAGSLLRLSLFALPRLCDALADRPEVSTPATSFKRRTSSSYSGSPKLKRFRTVQEGLYLFDRGLDPYEGDLFQQVRSLGLFRHIKFRRMQSPLYLAFFRLLPKHRLPVAACYTLVDAAIAGLLYAIASKKNSKTTASPVQALAASAVCVCSLEPSDHRSSLRTATFCIPLASPIA